MRSRCVAGGMGLRNGLQLAVVLLSWMKRAQLGSIEYLGWGH